MASEYAVRSLCLPVNALTNIRRVDFGKMEVVINASILDLNL